MLQVKSPLRISFCGGGTDMKEFYSRYGGCVVSATINKYVYLGLTDNFNANETILNYSSLAEKVTEFDQIQHDRFRQCLKLFDVSGVNISSMSDVPFGTGLGSSSAFTVGLIKLLMTYNRKHGKPISFGEEYYNFPDDYEYDIAKLACDIEINKLQTYSGKQDQYASTFGGLNFIMFNKDESVDVIGLSKLMPNDKIEELENHLVMFYIGGVHNSSEIVKKQIETMESDSRKISMLHEMFSVTMELRKQLLEGNISFVGEALKENWNIKRSLSDGITNPKIDAIYETAIENGAYSGKLLGAGGAGFMLFYVLPENKKHLIEHLESIGLKEFPFKFDMKGVRKMISY